MLAPSFQVSKTRFYSLIPLSCFHVCIDKGGLSSSASLTGAFLILVLELLGIREKISLEELANTDFGEHLLNKTNGAADKMAQLCSREGEVRNGILVTFFLAFAKKREESELEIIFWCVSFHHFILLCSYLRTMISFSFFSFLSPFLFRHFSLVDFMFFCLTRQEEICCVVVVVFRLLNTLFVFHTTIFLPVFFSLVFLSWVWTVMEPGRYDRIVSDTSPNLRSMARRPNLCIFCRYEDSSVRIIVCKIIYFISASKV